MHSAICHAVCVCVCTLLLSTYRDTRATTQDTAVPCLDAPSAQEGTNLLTCRAPDPQPGPDPPLRLSGQHPQAPAGQGAPAARLPPGQRRPEAPRTARTQPPPAARCPPAPGRRPAAAARCSPGSRRRPPAAGGSRQRSSARPGPAPRHEGSAPAAVRAVRAVRAVGGGRWGPACLRAA